MADDALAARLLVIFIDELDEQVQQLNDDLLVLERTPDDAERLRAVFRVMHTLKGAARAAGLPLVEELCHALENELSRVRDGSAKLGAPQIALLFETADALAETRDSLRRDRTVPEETLSNALHHARGRGSAAPLVRPQSRTPVVPTLAPPLESPSAPPLAPSAPVVVAPNLERVDDAARAGHIRVSLQQVDAIAGAAGEI